MKTKIPHYGDVLKKIERTIDSCKTVDQLGAAWQLAGLFENQCERAGVSSETRMLLISTVNNRLNDRWEEIMNERNQARENEIESN
jgi:hypothetical protein